MATDRITDIREYRRLLLQEHAACLRRHNYKFLCTFSASRNSDGNIDAVHKQNKGPWWGHLRSYSHISTHPGYIGRPAPSGKDWPSNVYSDFIAQFCNIPEDCIREGQHTTVYMYGTDRPYRALALHTTQYYARIYSIEYDGARDDVEAPHLLHVIPWWYRDDGI